MIPKTVQRLIEAEKARQAEEAAQRQAEQDCKKQEMIKKGRIIFEEYVNQIIVKTPEWIRRYVVRVIKDEDLEDIGRGYKPDRHLLFRIPGIADLQFDGDTGYFRSCMAIQENTSEQPGWSWSRSQWEKLPAALVMAQEQCDILKKMRLDYKTRLLERERWREQDERQERLHAEQARKTKAKEKAEDEALFSALKDDLVAVTLMKAFLAIRQERQMFEEQISQADDALLSMEERWTRKAAELRRQAADAESRAEEERSRVMDLEDDLSKAKKKVKQMEQGW